MANMTSANESREQQQYGDLTAVVERKRKSFSFEVQIKELTVVN